MESQCRLALYPPSPPEVYPKYLTGLEEAGDFVKGLKENKARILSRAQSDEENLRIQVGIMCIILCERKQNQFEFKDLIVITRDNLKYCSSCILSLISEFWPKLTQTVRSNILQLLIEFMTYPVAENLFTGIMKRMITGDTSANNLSLIENVLVLIQEHKEVMLKERKYVPLITYTYLRLIPTHYQHSIGSNAPTNNIGRLYRKEIDLVIDIIRNNFDDCFKLGGRDMLFLILQVVNIPEFSKLWTDMLKNLTTISNQFKEIGDIFAIGSPKSLLTSSIPFEMENWVLWLMRNVHHCSNIPYKRYQDIFSKKFFSTPESHNLRPFLIRYIVRVFYPDNEMIGSTLISRWATISWLIIQSSPSIILSLCKLALIYDWLFYEKTYDCIMDIEPAILAIMYNLNKYSHLSISIVDFLVKTINHLIPQYKTKMSSRIRNGLNEAIRLNVFRNIGALNEVLKHHPELLRQFSELINDPNLIQIPPVTNPTNPINQTSQSTTPTSLPQQTVTAQISNTETINTTTTIAAPVVQKNADPATFAVNLPDKNGIPKPISPAKERILEITNKVSKQNQIVSPAIFDATIKPIVLDEPSPDINIKENITESLDEIHRKFMKYSLAYDYEIEHIDVRETIDQISSNVTSALENLYNAAQQSSFASRGKLKKQKRYAKKIPQKIDDDDISDEECVQELCEKMERVVIDILSDDDNFDDLGTSGKTAAVICEICYPYFEKKLYPGNQNDEEKLKASLTTHPVFVILKSICNMSSSDNKREVLLLLLSEMQMRQPRIGYYLLYYLKVAKIKDADLSIYRSLCNSLEKPNLKNSLYKDLELLTNDDSKLMVFLLPDLYKAFSAEMVNNPKFAHLIISSVDASEINLLLIEINKNNLVMFDSATIVDLLKASLEWGTIEQYFLWELIVGHNFPTKSFYGLIPYLNHKNHPEALTKLSNILKQDKISIEVGKLLLNRDVHDDDHFVCTLLQFWAVKSKTKFTDVIHTIMTASLGHNARDRKKKYISGNDDITVDLIKVLEHLDFMRKYCDDISFLVEESIQMDLKQVLDSRSLCDEIKARFSELLAFVEDDSDDLQIDESANTSTTTKGRNLRQTEGRKLQNNSPSTNITGGGALAGTKRLYMSQSPSSSENEDDDDDMDDDLGDGRRLKIDGGSDDDEEDDDDDMGDDNDTNRRHSKKSNFHPPRPKKRMTLLD